MKFLILRFSSIGDIVLTTPIIRCLKLQLLDAEIHFATKKQYAQILDNNPYISKVHSLEKDENLLIDLLKNEDFDYIIDLHHNLRTLRIKWALKAKSFSFDKLNFEKWLLVNFKINKLPQVHIVDRYFKTIESFGIKNDMDGLDYFIPEKDKIKILEVTNFQNYIAFAIGGQHFTKKLPISRLIELCVKIDQPIILLGGKEDTENGEIIKKAVGKNIFNACGKYNLNQSAYILEQAVFVISHDTGLMHIASAMKKKVISVWGNTVPAFGMYPYLTDFAMIENNNLRCRPCSKIGFDKCPKGHFKCMKELDLNIFNNKIIAD